MSKCHQCQKPIWDRYLLNVQDRLYHERCLQCDQCGQSLAESDRCFWRFGQILCARDYHQQAALPVSCHACGQTLQSGQSYISGVWPRIVHHTHCFTCAFCSAPLNQVGTRVLLWNQFPVCAHHQLSLPAVVSTTDTSTCASAAVNSTSACASTSVSTSASTSGASASLPASTCTSTSTSTSTFTTTTSTTTTGTTTTTFVSACHTSASVAAGATDARNVEAGGVHSQPEVDPKTDASVQISTGTIKPGKRSLTEMISKCKRMRTTFRNSQLKAMRAHFNANQNPDGLELKQLSARTGLSKRVLQVWFQNARAKWRRHFFRQKCIGPQTVEAELQLPAGDADAGQEPKSDCSNDNGQAAGWTSDRLFTQTGGHDLWIKAESSSDAPDDLRMYEATICQIEQPFWTSVSGNMVLDHV